MVLFRKQLPLILSVNDLPSILGNFAQFKHTTETSEELEEVPADSSAPSPQDIVYTNNIHIDTSEAYIDAQYVKSLPATPDNFYIKHEDSLVGIVDGGVSLQLVRGRSIDKRWNITHVNISLTSVYQTTKFKAFADDKFC